LVFDRAPTSSEKAPIIINTLLKWSQQEKFSEQTKSIMFGCNTTAVRSISDHDMSAKLG
jgi:hypothetical protein